MKNLKLKISHKVEFTCEGQNLGSSLIQDIQEECFLTTMPMQGFKKKDTS